MILVIIFVQCIKKDLDSLPSCTHIVINLSLQFFFLNFYTINRIKEEKILVTRSLLLD